MNDENDNNKISSEENWEMSDANGIEPENGSPDAPDDWEMSNPQLSVPVTGSDAADEWVMPQPVFRISGGRSLKRSGDAGDPSESEASHDDWAFPDSVIKSSESEETASELSPTPEFPAEEIEAAAEGSDDPPSAPASQPDIAEEADPPAEVRTTNSDSAAGRGLRLLLVIISLAAIFFLAAALLLAVYFMYFYKADPVPAVSDAQVSERTAHSS